MKKANGRMYVYSSTINVMDIFVQGKAMKQNCSNETELPALGRDMSFNFLPDVFIP